jgi:S-adenosylmethionine:tRNA ribosyltransferase-isomerase
MDFDLAGYDYDLPECAIAQAPVEPRDHSRLLVIHPQYHEHHFFYELPTLLQSHDVLVVNDTRVLPARLLGTRPSGGKAEIFLLHEVRPQVWECLVKPGSRLPVGMRVTLPLGVQAEIVAHTPEGHRQVQFHLPTEIDFWTWLQQAGEVPLPPYVTGRTTQPEQYQTVYARMPGAVAAPTAGLHFTPELLQTLRDKNITIATLTLHVGVGTFRPVQVQDIREHTLHQEWLSVPESTVAQIKAAQAKGGRVIAVGTTSARALETASQTGELMPWSGWSGLYIYPGYTWRTVQGMITNFHLPKSSLMMMISTLVGRERLLMLYQEALEENYRFYSFGDAMLILPP